jgi:hypothetical protein
MRENRNGEDNGRTCHCWSLKNALVCQYVCSCCAVGLLMACVRDGGGEVLSL